MFRNPFLCPGTPQRSLYGRYVRLFLIPETPGPRLREITNFSVIASRQPCERSPNKINSATLTERAANGPDPYQHLFIHLLESDGRCGCRAGLHLVYT